VNSLDKFFIIIEKNSKELFDLKSYKDILFSQLNLMIDEVILNRHATLDLLKKSLSHSA